MPPRPLSVYLLASRSRALYVGVTNDVRRRLAEHRAGQSAHTARYRLVRVEEYAAPEDALKREKQLKGWSRSKKVALVESENPTWCDLDASRYRWTAEPPVGPGRGGTHGRGGSAAQGAPQQDGPRRDPSTPLRSAQDDVRGGRGQDLARASRSVFERARPAPVTSHGGRPYLQLTHNVIPSGGRSPESRDLDAPHAAARTQPERPARPTPPTLSERGPTAPPPGEAGPTPPAPPARPGRGG